MIHKISEILDWIKTSSFVCDSNRDLDIYLMKNDAKGRLKSGKVVNLNDWLESFAFNKDDDIFFEHIILGDYYLTNGYLLRGNFSDYFFLEKIRRVNGSHGINYYDIDELKKTLSQFDQVSSDPDHAISPIDGILAYEDKRTGLIWETGCIFISGVLDLPKDISSILNEISYAGYDDWRAATRFDLSTILSSVGRASNVIHPLSLVTPSYCWASFSKFRHDKKERYCLNTKTGCWYTDGYYHDKRAPDGEFMYVRGEAKVSDQEWINKLVHWLSLNDPFTDIYITNIDSQDIESTVPLMRNLSIYCNVWHEPPMLPKELKYLKELEKLTFNYGKRSESGACVDFDLIVNLRSLRSLTLVCNEITFVPSEIGRLTLLQELSLEDNLIESLPSEISELLFLSKIDLSRNNFTALPEELFSLPSLKEVSLEFNMIEKIPKIYGFPELESLNLKSNKLLEVPQSINSLKRLLSLDISDNNIKRLPAEVGQLKDLKSLNLSANPLLSLPAEIGQLLSLESLNLSSTALQYLPEEIGKLTNLKVLEISWTKVKRLPQSITNLKNLKVIKLNFTTKPEVCPNLSLSPDQLEWLRELIVSNNCRVNNSILDLLEGD